MVSKRLCTQLLNALGCGFHTIIPPTCSIYARQTSVKLCPVPEAMQEMMSDCRFQTKSSCAHFEWIPTRHYRGSVYVTVSCEKIIRECVVRAPHDFHIFSVSFIYLNATELKEESDIPPTFTKVHFESINDPTTKLCINSC